MSVLRPLRSTFTPYSHTRALADGDVSLPDTRLEFILNDPIIHAYREMIRHLSYDVAELAPTTYLMARASGIPVIAIPVFTKRQFHHGAILCRPDSGIRIPSDLTGRKVGVRAYSVTTGVWVRGLLSDDFDLDQEKVEWITDDEEHVPGYTAPPNVTAAPSGTSLVSLLRDGKIDAALTGNAGVGRSGPPRAGWVAEKQEEQQAYPLFAAPEPLERDWYRRTGIYPIHAVITLREELVRENPELPTALYQAFTKAKASADRGTLQRELAASSAIPADEDPVPYGIEPNRRSIEALMRYAVQQHLLDAPLPVEEIFAPGDYA